jgi:hypothetical protein
MAVAAGPLVDVHMVSYRDQFVLSVRPSWTAASATAERAVALDEAFNYANELSMTHLAERYAAIYESTHG